jgi:predicted lipoprotein with Yx(FWY)xxD motif
MGKLASAAPATIAAVLLAACGGGGGDSSGASSSGAGGATVSVKRVGDLGDTLVSNDGMTLYTADVESSGKISCTGACTSFWKPLEPGKAAPRGNANTGRLAVIKRPDGTMQVTSNGLPLYTFVQDGPGDAKGEGFTDDFASRHFVWHAVVAGGRASGASSSSGGGYSNGDDSGGSSSGGGDDNGDYSGGGY